MLNQIKPLLLAKARRENRVPGAMTAANVVIRTKRVPTPLGTFSAPPAACACSRRSVAPNTASCHPLPLQERALSP